MKHRIQIISVSILFIVFIFAFALQEGLWSTTTDMRLWSHNTLPAKLSIERLGIYADIESVGVVDNAMAVPSNIEDVGWYQYGAHPGDQGSAVLAGHVNWTGGRSAVFTELHSIAIGDIVEVIDTGGSTHRFIVRSIRDYLMDNDTTEIFTSSDGLSRLNLITCDGVWDPVLQTHKSRLVVFTEKI